MDTSDIKETLEESVIQSCDALYGNLSEREKLFCSAFKIRCRKGCGECCRHFQPDVTEPEALYMAYGLLQEGHADSILKMLKSYHKECCPFYDEKKFCTEYSYRPLICRLFNACASNDRNGNPVFHSCKWTDFVEALSIRDFQKKENLVITMEEYGQQMEEILPGETETKLLQDAIPMAIGKLSMILLLKKENDSFSKKKS